MILLFIGCMVPDYPFAMGKDFPFRECGATCKSHRQPHRLTNSPFLSTHKTNNRQYLTICIGFLTIVWSHFVVLNIFHQILSAIK